MTLRWKVSKKIFLWLSTASLVTLFFLLITQDIQGLKFFLYGFLTGVPAWWITRRKVMGEKEFYSKYFSLSEKERLRTPLPESMRERMIKERKLIIPQNYRQKFINDMFIPMVLLFTTINLTSFLSSQYGIESFTGLLYYSLCSSMGFLLFAFLYQQAIDSVHNIYKPRE